MKNPILYDIAKSSVQGVPQMIFNDGDCLDLGNRTLTIVHTPGHCCLYEPEMKKLTHTIISL